MHIPPPVSQKTRDCILAGEYTDTPPHKGKKEPCVHIPPPPWYNASAAPFSTLGICSPNIIRRQKEKISSSSSALPAHPCSFQSSICLSLPCYDTYSDTMCTPEIISQLVCRVLCGIVHILRYRYYLGGGISLKAHDWQITFYVCYFLKSCVRVRFHCICKFCMNTQL